MSPLHFKTFLFFLIAIPGMAQVTNLDKFKVDFAEAAPLSPEVFVEFSIPIDQSEMFDVAIDEQIVSGVGVGGKFGWQPWVNSRSKNILKNLGFTVDANGFVRTPFKDYLYTTEERVFDEDQTCYSWSEYRQDYYWDGTCYRCSNGPGLCQDQRVYGRDAYVKYTSSTIAIGTYLSLEVTKRLTVEGGANIRWHFVKEGVQTDKLNSSVEASLGVVGGAAFKLTKNTALTGSFEYAVRGRKYRAYQVGVRVYIP